MYFSKEVKMEAVAIAKECVFAFKNIDAKTYRHHIEKLQRFIRMIEDGTKNID